MHFDKFGTCSNYFFIKNPLKALNTFRGFQNYSLSSNHNLYYFYSTIKIFSYTDTDTIASIASNNYFLVPEFSIVQNILSSFSFPYKTFSIKGSNSTPISLGENNSSTILNKIQPE